MLSMQLLVSTMHQSDYSLLDRMNVCSSAVVINQCDEDKREEFNIHGRNIIWINTVERGLSRSRNMALRNATADICVLADDDEVFLEGYEEQIKSVFERRMDISIFRFKINGIESMFKEYPEKSYNINYVTSLKLSSVELAFKRKDIINCGIFFNERLGSGTEFKMGEENVFLVQCISKGLKVAYEPIEIANLHIDASSWFTGFDDSYFIGRGAAFTAISRKYSIFLILQFALRRYHLYKDNMTLFQACRLMMRGREKYLSE